MHAITVFYYVVAAILLVGGIIGYQQAKSVMSLGGGFGTAVLFALAGIVMAHHPRLGLAFGLLGALIVLGIFVMRYAKTKKAMPAIPMIVLGAVAAVYTVIMLIPVLQHPLP
jgi:uncharacterized membrane protein (UPF0136 family)